MIVVRPYSLPVSAMGLDKSGNQTIAGGGAWTELNTWTVRSGNTATVQGSNGFVVDGDGLVNVTCKVTFGASSASDRGARIKKNGSVVEQLIDTASGSSTTFTTASPFIVTSGDIITLEAYHVATGATVRAVQAGSTNTYFYMTP